MVVGSLSTVRRFVRSSRNQSDQLAGLMLVRDVRSFARVNFLFVCGRLGLPAELERPRTKDELVTRLGITRTELFESLLDLGVALGELGYRRGRYRLRGMRSKALAGRQAQVWQACLEELIRYHGSVYQGLADRLRGAELGDYLPEMAAVVAESSRVFESVIAGYLREVVGGRKDAVVLDIGCGSGVYLRVAADTAPGSTGVGIDIQSGSVQLAGRNLRTWQISDRFDVIQGDVREGVPEHRPAYDVAIMINNVYYFTPEQRCEVFGSVRKALTDGGTLVVISLFHGKKPTTLVLDLVLGSTSGCYLLPELETIESELRAAGFTDLQTDQLVPGLEFFAIRAGTVLRREDG